MHLIDCCLFIFFCFFLFKQKSAYEMRIMDWSSDVCSADLDAGTDLVVIDGAAVARDVAYEAARQADFILIPTKTAVFDTMSMTHTLDVVRQLDRAFAVVLTFVPPQGQETGDAIQAVAELGATV